MATSWRMLVYIAADNSLYADALVSLRQITEASLSSNIEILVQFDGPTPELASRYRCANGERTLYWQAGEGYTTDRSQRLEEFLVDSGRNSGPSKHTFLVLWGHGGGLDHVYVYSDASGSQPDQSQELVTRPRSGSHHQAPTGPSVPAIHDLLATTLDLLNAGDANRYVKNIQLGQVLLKFTERTGKKIDVLGLDACLMGMAEICHELRDSVSLLVASDEDLPTGSWPYDLIVHDLSTFNGMDPRTLSAVIISRFLERYSEKDNEARVSLSAYDLSVSEDLAVGFKALVNALSEGLDDSSVKNRIERARDFSRTLDEHVYIDLTAFCTELAACFEPSSLIHKCALDVLNLVTTKPYIVYHRHSGDPTGISSCGVALYFPATLAAEEVDAHASPVEPSHLTGHKSPPSTMKSPPSTMKSPPSTMKSPPSTMKSPPSTMKSPPSTMKSPPSTMKNVITINGRELQITSYRVVWSSYKSLEFNQETGWAGFISKFLPERTSD